MAIGQSNVLEFSVHGRADGQEIVNIMHWHPKNPPPAIWTDPAIADYSGTLIGRWRANVCPGLASNYAVEVYKFKVWGDSVINPAPPPPAQLAAVDGFELASDPLLDVGSQPGLPDHTFAAVAARKFTGVSGRNWRGGIRFGPVAEAISDVNALTPAQLANYQAVVLAMFADMVDGIGGNPMTHCVFSKTLNTSAAGRAARTDSRAVTSMIVNPFISSQISRKRSVYNPT
jgi:hypothetical protein